MGFWVSTEIITCKTSKERAKKISKFIEVAACCYQLGNFNGLMEMISGLNVSSVQRLKSSWEMVPQKDKIKLQKLEQTMTPLQNYKKYRAIFKEKEHPKIPYFAVILKDLMFVNIGNCDYTDSGVINFEKLILVYDKISEVTKQQKECRSARKLSLHAYREFGRNRRSIRKYMRKLHAIKDENVLYSLSQEMSVSENLISRASTINDAAGKERESLEEEASPSNSLSGERSVSPNLFMESGDEEGDSSSNYSSPSSSFGSLPTFEESDHPDVTGAAASAVGSAVMATSERTDYVIPDGRSPVNVLRLNLDEISRSPQAGTKNLSFSLDCSALPDPKPKRKSNSFSEKVKFHTINSSTPVARKLSLGNPVELQPPANPPKVDSPQFSPRKHLLYSPRSRSAANVVSSLIKSQSYESVKTAHGSPVPESSSLASCSSSPLPSPRQQNTPRLAQSFPSRTNRTPQTTPLHSPQTTPRKDEIVYINPLLDLQALNASPQHVTPPVSPKIHQDYSPPVSPHKLLLLRKINLDGLDEMDIDETAKEKLHAWKKMQIMAREQDTKRFQESEKSTERTEIEAKDCAHKATDSANEGNNDQGGDNDQTGIVRKEREWKLRERQYKMERELEKQWEKQWRERRDKEKQKRKKQKEEKKLEKKLYVIKNKDKRSSVALNFRSWSERDKIIKVEDTEDKTWTFSGNEVFISELRGKICERRKKYLDLLEELNAGAKQEGKNGGVEPSQNVESSNRTEETEGITRTRDAVQEKNGSDIFARWNDGCDEEEWERERKASIAKGSDEDEDDNPIRAMMREKKAEINGKDPKQTDNRLEELMRAMEQI